MNLSMRSTATVKSIPTGPPKKKAQLFTSGALKTPQFAPRGHGYYDAFVQTPDSVMVSATTGPCTVIDGYSSDAVPGGLQVSGTYQYQGETADGAGALLSATHSGNESLIFFNPGSSDDVVAHVYKLGIDPAAPGSVPTLQVVTTPIKVTQFHELGPTKAHSSLLVQHRDAHGDINDKRPGRRVESIPLRGSIRIRNVTEALSVGGSVRALRYNGGIQLNDDGTSGSDSPSSVKTVEQFLKVCEMVRDSSRTRVWGGGALCHVHQSNTYPADFVRSMAFETDNSFEEAVARPSYCTHIMLIDNFTASTNMANNSYEISVKVQRAARFGMGTLLHSMARNLRTGNTHPHTVAESSGDGLRPTGPVAGGRNMMVR